MRARLEVGDAAFAAPMSAKDRAAHGHGLVSRA
jgi:uncharacterized membrane protein